MNEQRNCDSGLFRDGTSIHTEIRMQESENPLTEIWEGELHFCLEQRMVEICGQEIMLTAKEFSSEWVRVEGAHEAIIQKHDFDLVQRLRRIDTRTSPKSDKVYLFSGILICGCCGCRMTRKTNRYKDKEYHYPCEAAQYLPAANVLRHPFRSGRGAFILWQRHSAICRPFPERYRAVPGNDDEAGESGRRVTRRLFYQPCALLGAQFGGDRP